jgi:catechol 2,3-dioxygenase-like lactoylglutathione lyase family enzyme
MTQTLNALHTRLSGSKKSLVKEASTRKRAGRRDARIGHVGLHVTNPAASAEFYRDVFGMEITGGSASDHPLGATAFLSSRPGEEPHDIVLVANPEVAHIAFKVSSLHSPSSDLSTRARCGEEDPDQVRIQSPRVLRFLFRRP